jgi:hypothetical protein
MCPEESTWLPQNKHLPFFVHSTVEFVIELKELHPTLFNRTVRICSEISVLADREVATVLCVVTLIWTKMHYFFKKCGRNIACSRKSNTFCSQWIYCTEITIWEPTISGTVRILGMVFIYFKNIRSNGIAVLKDAAFYEYIVSRFIYVPIFWARC